MEMEKTESQVKTLLSDDPRTRDSDLYLVVRYWQIYDNIPIHLTDEEMDRMTTAETITRARRKIQQQGLYKSSDPDVIKRRSDKNKRIRRHYGGK